VQVKLIAFLTYTVDGGEKTASLSGPLSRRGKNPRRQNRSGPNGAQ